MRMIRLAVLLCVVSVVGAILLPPAIERLQGETANSEEKTEQKPSAAPPMAITVPCLITEVVDGDTLTCRVTCDVRVRLLDCWAAETRSSSEMEKAAGLRAKLHLQNVCGQATAARISLPLDEARRIDDVLSFGRLLGRVWVEGPDHTGDLSTIQVETGHAYRRKVELQKALAE